MKALSKPAFVCASCARTMRQQLPIATTTTLATTASFATTTRTNASSIDPTLPRYRQTPPAMKMPHRLRPHPKQSPWKVNEDEETLNAAYDKFLSRIGGNNVRGRDLLDDQTKNGKTKWLALTHKSFDHGRQGFNDRLAFLGKRIVDLQTSLALLNGPTMTTTAVNSTHNLGSDESSPSPLETDLLPSSSSSSTFQDPALEGLENVTAFAKHATLSPRRLAGLASTYGLDRAVRWKPRNADDLRTSGVDVVMAHALYGVVGALALRCGGETAARAVRERILQPLGLR